MAERDTFHHGNLRSELIEAGHAALNQSGVDGFSLRKLAIRAGVSQSAPYRHFANKEALLQELIDGGLEELLVAYRAAATLEGSPADRLRAACVGYLDFAANRPGLFQLVFESDGFNATAVTSSEEAPSFVLFTEMVADAGPAIAERDQVEAATLCWSIIHGYASLKSHAELPRMVDADSVRTVVLDTAVRAASEWGQPH